MAAWAWASSGSASMPGCSSGVGSRSASFPNTLVNTDTFRQPQQIDNARPSVVGSSPGGRRCESLGRPQCGQGSSAWGIVALLGRDEPPQPQLRPRLLRGPD